MLNSDDIAQIYKTQELIKEKSGIYLGFGLGTSIMRLISTDGLGSDSPPTPYSPVIFSIKAGTQSFFTKNVGVRGFFALDMFGDGLNYNFKKTSYKSVFTMLSLGLDAIVEFPFTPSNKHFIGFYVGAGFAGVLYVDNQNYSGIQNLYASGGLIVEAGLELTFFIHHRISTGVKITPIQKDTSAPFIEQTDFLSSVMYSYLF